MHLGPLPWGGLAFQSAIGERRALFHAQQTHTTTSHRLVTEGGNIESNAVVAHVEVKMPVLFADLDRHRASPRVSHYVGERFLAHTKTGGFDNRIQALLQRVSLKFSPKPGQR